MRIFRYYFSKGFTQNRPLVSENDETPTALETLNPLRYRGYVYDQETGLYYLQSRYYNPEMGRFINADGYTSTGQDLLGNNMFAYCGNNPVVRSDYGGTRYCEATTIRGESKKDRSRSCQEQLNIAKDRVFRKTYAEELEVLEGKTSTYKGVQVFRVNAEDASFSFGFIFLSNAATPDIEGIRWLRHEYGHTIQLRKLGVVHYTAYVVLPSLAGFYSSDDWIKDNYYSLPWEFEADIYGQVPSRGGYACDVLESYNIYSSLVKSLT